MVRKSWSLHTVVALSNSPRPRRRWKKRLGSWSARPSAFVKLQCAWVSNSKLKKRNGEYE